MKNQVAKIIEEYRNKFNLSFRELEELSGISYSTIHLHLKGERNISFSDLNLYQKALNKAKEKKCAKLHEEGKENGFGEYPIEFIDLIRPIPHYPIIGYIDLETGFVENRDERPTEIIIASQDKELIENQKAIAVIPNPKVPHAYENIVGFFKHTKQKIEVNQFAYFKCISPEGYRFGCVGVMLNKKKNGKADIENRIRHRPHLHKNSTVLEAFRISALVWSDFEDIIRIRTKH